MLKHILQGGPIMLPLLALSVIAVAVIIDRLRVFRMAQSDVGKLRRDVRGHIEEGNVDKAIAECEETKGPVAAVLMTGLVKFSKMLKLKKPAGAIEDGVNKAMTDYSPRVIETLEKRLNLLLMVASVSPLLGMTGTVTGMIASFETMSSGLDANMVSAGIAEALVTTAAGLIIAIPSVVAYHIFAKKVDKLILDIEESGNELVEAITMRGVDT
jgi:biopolymer transport protein ExbB